MAGKRCIIPMMRTRRGRLAAIFLLAVTVCALAWLLWPGGQDAPRADERLRSAAQDLTAYDVTLRLDPQAHTLAISETVSYRNDTGDTLDTLVLRTWLNAFQREETSPAAVEELYDACYPDGFSPGYVTMYDVIWQGERAGHAYLDEAQTALRVDIPPLRDGEEGTLEVRCVATIPRCAHRTGISGSVWQLGNVLPLLPIYEDGAWRTDPYSPFGDPFLHPCANYTVTLHAPEGYVPACSAPLVRGEDGAWRGQILAARDVGLCVSPDYVAVSGRAGNTAVHSYARTEAGARRALESARKALDTFSALYGEMPCPALTVCSADFPFGGMEYSGLCMIGESNYLDSRADTLELTVAHETAHQWFGGLVGSDQVKNPWQDEALCQYAMLRYVRARYGQGSFETLKALQVDAPMRESIPGALTPGSPIDYFGNLSDYSTVVYGRGAALLLALDEILPQGVDAFLRAYAETFAFRYVTREAFEEFLNEQGQMDLRPLLLDYLDTAWSARDTKERVLA